MIRGYKAFNADDTNRYGLLFSQGGNYHVDGKIRFGNHGNGFHICAHLCDVFRFFDSTDCVVAEVEGFGEVDYGEYQDWMEPYYDMYAVSDLHVVRFLSRKEILDEMKKASESDLIKFFATFSMTKEEALELIESNWYKVGAVRAYLYYICHKNVYGQNIEDEIIRLKKVFYYGQNNS